MDTKQCVMHKPVPNAQRIIAGLGWSGKYVPPATFHSRSLIADKRSSHLSQCQLDMLLTDQAIA